MRPATDTTTDLQLRWLRLKRHLRSCAASARALRDAARVLSTASGHEPGVTLPMRSRLCRARSAREARRAA